MNSVECSDLRVFFFFLGVGLIRRCFLLEFDFFPSLFLTELLLIPEFLWQRENLSRLGVSRKISGF